MMCMGEGGVCMSVCVGGWWTFSIGRTFLGLWSGYPTGYQKHRPHNIAKNLSGSYSSSSLPLTDTYPPNSLLTRSANIGLHVRTREKVGPLCGSQGEELIEHPVWACLQTRQCVCMLYCQHLSYIKWKRVAIGKNLWRKPVLQRGGGETWWVPEQSEVIKHTGESVGGSTRRQAALYPLLHVCANAGLSLIPSFKTIDNCFLFWGFGFILKTGSCYVAQAGLELTILLPQSSQYWDYRCVPPRSA
jgi:hypothetical protein